MTTVLLADDSYLIRREIKRVLENYPAVQLIGETDAYAETLRLARALLPDVVLLDMYMPGLKETSVEEIKNACLKCRILLMSIHTDEEVTEFAAQLGAESFIDKAKLFDELIPAITQ
jgi:DNA-binding NarL/FixJ family response regulator